MIEHVLVAGAGAVGGFILAAIANNPSARNVRLSVLAIERSAAVLREKGVRIEASSFALQARPHIVTALNEIDSFDLAIVATKTPECSTDTAGPCPLCRTRSKRPNGNERRPVVPSVTEPPLLGAPLQSIDPSGTLFKGFPLPTLDVAVVDFACSRSRTELITHRFGRTLRIGHTVSNPSRLRAICEVISNPWLDCIVDADIRKSLWSKLINNGSMNPISLLTAATLADMSNPEGGGSLVRLAMSELEEIGTALGLGPFLPIEDRIASRAAFGSVNAARLGGRA